MLLAQPYKITVAIILVCAFLVDSWYTVRRSSEGYTDFISFHGFLKAAPWLRTAIKLPLVLLFFFGTLNIGSSDYLGRDPLISFTYTMLVGYSIYRFHRSGGGSRNTDTPE